MCVGKGGRNWERDWMVWPIGRILVIFAFKIRRKFRGPCKKACEPIWSNMGDKILTRLPWNSGATNKPLRSYAFVGSCLVFVLPSPCLPPTHWGDLIQGAQQIGDLPYLKKPIGPYLVLVSRWWSCCGPQFHSYINPNSQTFPAYVAIFIVVLPNAAEKSSPLVSLVYRLENGRKLLLGCIWGLKIICRRLISYFLFGWATWKCILLASLMEESKDKDWILGILSVVQAACPKINE